MNETAAKVTEHNFKEFVEKGPGLRTTTQTCIVAKAPGKVLVYGLGGMGVGQMWCDEQDYHKERDGYAEAPIVADPEKVYFNVLRGELVAIE